MDYFLVVITDGGNELKSSEKVKTLTKEHKNKNPIK
jgi:hypothetical protein